MGKALLDWRTWNLIECSIESVGLLLSWAHRRHWARLKWSKAHLSPNIAGLQLICSLQPYGTFKQRCVSENIVFFFSICIICIIDIRDEPSRPVPVRPGRSFTIHSSVSLEIKNLNYLHNLDIGSEVVVSKLELRIFRGFKVISFLVEAVFCLFQTLLRITHEPLNISKMYSFHMKDHQTPSQIQCIYVFWK